MRPVYHVVISRGARKHFQNLCDAQLGSIGKVEFAICFDVRTVIKYSIKTQLIARAIDLKAEVAFFISVPRKKVIPCYCQISQSYIGPEFNNTAEDGRRSIDQTNLIKPIASSKHNPISTTARCDRLIARA